jgi:hypothetical protein
LADQSEQPNRLRPVLCCDVRALILRSLRVAGLKRHTAVNAPSAETHELHHLPPYATTRCDSFGLTAAYQNRNETGLGGMG